MPGSVGQGFNNTVITANTAATILGQTTTTNVANPLIQGFLHAISIGADTTANTVTIYDNIAASGKVLFKMVTPTTTVPLNFVIDVQAEIGITVALSGGSTPTLNISYS